MSVSPSSLVASTRELCRDAADTIAIDARSGALLRVALGVYIMVDVYGNWPDRCDMFSDEEKRHHMRAHGASISLCLTLNHVAAGRVSFCTQP